MLFLVLVQLVALVQQPRHTMNVFKVLASYQKVPVDTSRSKTNKSPGASKQQEIPMASPP